MNPINPIYQIQYQLMAIDHDRKYRQWDKPSEVESVVGLPQSLIELLNAWTIENEDTARQLSDLHLLAQWGQQHQRERFKQNQYVRCLVPWDHSPCHHCREDIQAKARQKLEAETP